mmetsp:Transcript_29740/g.79133  ORF Transcript_29740/g.79133 Transcript_29740/m.79133 type:complete len:142 (+) Transcript_29740:1553-1978(+)
MYFQGSEVNSARAGRFGRDCSCCFCEGAQPKSAGSPCVQVGAISTAGLYRCFVCLLARAGTSLVCTDCTERLQIGQRDHRLILVEGFGMQACVVCLLVVASWLGIVKAIGLKSHACTKTSWFSSRGNLALQVVFNTESRPL